MTNVNVTKRIYFWLASLVNVITVIRGYHIKTFCLMTCSSWVIWICVSVHLLCICSSLSQSDLSSTPKCQLMLLPATSTIICPNACHMLPALVLNYLLFLQYLFNCLTLISGGSIFFNNTVESIQHISKITHCNATNTLCLI